ncbi:MAG: hypothetical protein A2V75_03190 [Actinobacteria bacterium RBG_16_70_17]|nr:MAG: hypothetical protein A2V75_03190 [Actinobacteria bacterium RBG_16_70_17]
MNARRPLVALLALLVVAAVLVGCGSREHVITQEGEIPDSVPDDFPVPADATVGVSVVDQLAHQTEFALALAQGVEEAAQYYLVNLVSSGYVVESSAGDDTRWGISFSRGALRGTVRIEAGETGCSVVVNINQSGG